MPLVKTSPFHSLSKEEMDNIHQIYSRNFLLSPWSKEYFNRYFNDLCRNPIGCCLKLDEKIIGFIWGRASLKNNRFFNLSALWVDPAYRGKGYGDILIKNFLESVSSLGSTTKTYLHFRVSNDLQKYYSRFGFSNHRTDGTYKNGGVRHYMDIYLK